ncbi:MAG: Gmad2 immunoglobulin-like domain-containing protein [Gemmatimonadetes bacterium]|nr:Gmad2 immunoglobulin-like domain-containing protein [Gemmatimonadota bacterium]
MLLPIGIACGGTDGGAGGPDRATPGGPEAGGAAATSELPVCLQGERYVADGPVAVAPPAGGDARTVSALRWGRHPGCERFVIDLADDAGQAASTPGVVTADVLRALGVLRVELREVERVDPDATDAGFDGRLGRAAYVVRSPDGRGTFVDLHLGEPAEAAVLVLDNPARVVVDLRPGGGPLPPPAVTGGRVVVLEPRGGGTSYPLTVTGYARTFEASVVARLERDGRVVDEIFTTATAWVDAWGHYSLTFTDRKAGADRLHVGEYSARDGAWEGVEVPLDTR